MGLNPIAAGALALSFICLVLSIVGIATNNWAECQSHILPSGEDCGRLPNYPHSMGLWYSCGSYPITSGVTSEDTCWSWYLLSANKAIEEVPDWLQAAGAFSVMGLIALTVCFFASIGATFMEKMRRLGGMTIGGSAIAACICYCIAVVVFWTCSLDQLIDTGSPVGETPWYMSGYSLILVAVSSGLLILVGIAGGAVYFQGRSS